MTIATAVAYVAPGEPSQQYPMTGEANGGT
jgi:hypothetical protein